MEASEMSVQNVQLWGLEFWGQKGAITKVLQMV